MTKTVNVKNNKNEFWFSWLTRKLNSCKSLDDFASGQNPEDVAEKFISVNSLDISKVFKNFDREDKDTLEKFQKLTECEWHIFRILKNQIELEDKILYVDFKKKKKENKQ